MKKVLSIMLIALTITGCTPAEQPVEAPVEAPVESTVPGEENQEEIPAEEKAYTLVPEVYEDKDNAVRIVYMQMEGYKGELTQGYINQSLEKIVDLYSDTGYLLEVSISPVTWVEDQDVLSITYEGKGVLQGGRVIEILMPVTIDMATSNENTYDNLILDDEAVRAILAEKVIEQELAEFFEAEGIRMYMDGENIYFAYMPLDDSADEFIRVSVPKSELEQYLNTDFGDHPAS